MLNVLETVTCGTFGVEFDAIIPNLVHYVVLAIQIFIPIVLVVLGMLDMGKAVMAGDEKAMKENQNKFIKRLIYAVIVFLIVALVRLVFNVLSTADVPGSKTSQCITCFIEGTGAENGCAKGKEA